MLRTSFVYGLEHEAQMKRPLKVPVLARVADPFRLQVYVLSVILLP